jgi:hypothetical protein
MNHDWGPMASAPKSPVSKGVVQGHYLELYCPDMVGPTSDPKAGICIGWWEPLMKPPQWHGEAGYQLNPTHWRELRPAPSDAEMKG